MGDIQQDLLRRDFTIDAMAIDLKAFFKDSAECKVIDPCKAQTDLNQKTIKAVNETIFEADPARLLRAVRLAAELEFSISPETETLMRRL